jgi:hypothetical protein
MQLSQISHSSVDDSSLDPERLHSRSHDTSKAQHCPAGCSITMTVPGRAQSTQWVPGGNPCSPMGRLASIFSSFGINLNTNSAGPACVLNGEKTGMMMLDQLECSLFFPLYPLFVYSNLSLESSLGGKSEVMTKIYLPR